MEALSDVYQIERELGRGGMATVYLAHDHKHDRAVALKVLDDELAAAIGADRFLREIRIAARLQHPHIVPLYDSGEARGRLFYVMPYVEGESLGERLRGHGALPPQDALTWVRQIADALGYAHAQGIVHRDIKPENILISGTHALVADFGIARAISRAGGNALTQVGLVIGTPAYMSPEQAAGAPDIDGRSDLYSLGCVLYEMLTGAPPFFGDTAHAMIAAHLTQPPPPLPRTLAQAFPAIEAAIARVLAKQASDRFPTAREFGDALVTAGATVRLVTPVATQATPVPDNSIAVLPFVNLSPDKDDEFFSDGMTEELIHALARVEGLRVASRTSAFAFKGKQEDVRTIAERLNVRTVLEGSVRRAGDRLRVTVQLISAADGYHMWSETYQRMVEDVFAIQDEISRAVVEALRIRLVGGTRRTLVKRYTDNVEAYTLYLQGRYCWNKRTEEGLTQATRFFEEAIAKDPQYALAYAGLADAYALIGVGYGAMAPQEAFTRARRAAERALAIDDALAEAYASLAFVAFRYEWNWRAADRGFQRALELDPNSVGTRHWYALYLLARQRTQEALAQMKKAHELDPLSLIITTGVGRMYHVLGDYDQAITYFRKTLDLDPNFPQAHFDLGLTYLSLGRYGEAIAMLQRAVDLSGGLSQGRTLWVAVLAWAYGLAGRRDEVLRVGAALDDLASRKHVSSYERALIQIGLGDVERAADYIERAFEERDSTVLYVAIDPNVSPEVREHPRVKAMLEQLE